MRFWIVALALCVAAGSANARQRRMRAEVEQPATAQAARGGANGGWTIESATTVGNCPGLIPGALEIAEGRISNAPELQGEAWGYVDGDGQIVARFTTADGRVARFHGSLRGGHGSGAWSSSTDMCGGTWRATRGGQERAAQ